MPSLVAIWMKLKVSHLKEYCFQVLSVTYYIEALSYRDMLQFVYLSQCLRLYLFVLHMLSVLLIIIFIFITINHIILLTQINLFFGHVCQKFSLRVLLSFYLIFFFFFQFQPDVTYKSVAYKKSVQCFIKQNVI